MTVTVSDLVHLQFDLGGGLRGCNPSPFGRNILQKKLILALFRAATPLSRPNSGQK